MTRRVPRRPRWVTVADAVLDGAVVAFAGWTVLYEVATAFRLSAWGTAIAWLPLAVLAAAFTVVRAVRVARSAEGREPPVATGEDGAARRPAVRTVATVAGATAVVAGAAVALSGEARAPVAWVLTLLGCMVLLLSVSLGRRTGIGPGGEGGQESVGAWSHLGAAVLTVALAGAMMFVLNPSADDIYYVNRSVWVAEHGTFSLRDTMFGPETYPASYGGGVPIASVEGLIGALAHLIGVSAASFSYLVVQPVGCLLAGWAVWRLVRAWAPRRPLLVLAGALLFSLTSATGTVGDFSYARMWQGKVLALCIVVPLAWLFLTRLTRLDRGVHQGWAVVMLAVCGLAFAGLTPTAMVMAPLVSAAAVLAALLLRARIGPVTLGAAAFSLFPVVAGLAVVLLSSGVGGADPKAPDVAQVVSRVLGEDLWVVAVAFLGFGLAPLLGRGRTGRIVAGTAAFAALAVFTPGIPELINAVTGSGPILYRLLLLAPLPVLVGLLLAAPVPSALPDPVRRAVPVLLAAALSGVLVLAGTPPWSADVGGRLTDRPTWKWHLSAMPEVRAVVEREPGPGPVLLPELHMKTLPLMTTRVAAVNPRSYYLRGVQEPQEQHRQRRLLARLLERPAHQLPRPRRVARALAGLDVSLVCTYPAQSDVLALVRAAGYEEAGRVGRLSCLRPAP